MTDSRSEEVGPGPTRVPALVVSGFLGSGKTSLVSHLLAQAQQRGVRIAVVSNELGELGIDRALLGEGGESFVEIEGGCVCCELSDDLIETLEMLHQRVHPDQIVIETSGVALPFDTQLNFWRKPVSEWIGDDTAIVVVNAEQVFEGRDLEGTFEDQVSSADLLILNKIDLVDEAQLPEIEKELRALEAEAPVVHAIRGDVDSVLLFPPDLGAVDRNRAPPKAAPHHHESFTTREWTVERGVEEAMIEAEIERINPLRAKGFVETEAGLRLLQVVGRRVEFSDVADPPPSEMIGRIVVIERAPV